MTDPMANRAYQSYRGDQASYRSRLLSSSLDRRVPATEPVDVWVDDVDGEWDDIVVPVAGERPATGSGVPLAAGSGTPGPALLAAGPLVAEPPAPER